MASYDYRVVCAVGAASWTAGWSIRLAARHASTTQQLFSIRLYNVNLCNNTALNALVTMIMTSNVENDKNSVSYFHVSIAYLVCAISAS